MRHEHTDLVANHARHLLDMVDAAQDCLRAKRLIPALVLLYSLIDSLSWAAADKRQSNLRSRFEDWVARWLLPNLPPSSPQITATDMYAARCAILHTGTGVSDLSTKKKAKQLMYAWGGASTESIEFAIKHSGLAEQHAALHYDELLKAVKAGMLSFFEDAESDPTLSSRLAEAASVQYANVPAGDSDA